MGHSPTDTRRLIFYFRKDAAGRFIMGGRGVAMTTAMGTVLANWAEGVPEHALDFPMTPAQPIPFHRFRQIGVGMTVASFRLMDRLGL